MRWVRYLPCITFWWLTITLIIAFVTAVLIQDEFGKIPDLTKLRALEPTGNIFGCLLTIAAKLIMATVSVRLKIIKLQLWCSWRKNKLAKILNKISNVCSLLGRFMVLFFAIQASVSIKTQETRRILLFHVMYIFPMLYLICQTFLECLLKWGDRTQRKINMIRILICILYSGMFFVGIVMLYFWFDHFHFQLDNEDAEENRDNCDYYQYKISAVFSWLRVFLLGVYILLFRYDFRKTDWLFSARHWYPQGITIAGVNIRDFYI